MTLASGDPFTKTHGFQGVWIVCAAAALGSLLFVHRLREAERIVASWLPRDPRTTL